LLAKPATFLYYPFGDDVKVFRMKKMFVTIILGQTAKKAKVEDTAKKHY